jgi:hypothetical protein
MIKAFSYLVLLTIFAVLLQTPFFAQERNYNHDEEFKVKFLIRAVDEKEKKNKATFNAGEKIFIEAMIKNDSEENYPHTIIYTYYHYQFNLQKKGKKSVEKHREDKIKSISAGQREPTSFSRMVVQNIKPGEGRLLDSLDLNDWYENPEPGEYRLTIQYRSEPGMPILISNTIMIDIK